MLLLIFVAIARSTRLLFTHIGEVYGFTIWKHQLVLLVIYKPILLFFSLFFVASDTSFIRVFSTNTIRINVTVLAPRDAVDANYFFFVRSIIIFESPGDRTVRVVITIPPDDLLQTEYVQYIFIKRNTIHRRSIITCQANSFSLLRNFYKYRVPDLSS